MITWQRWFPRWPSLEIWSLINVEPLGLTVTCVTHKWRPLSPRRSSCWTSRTSLGGTGELLLLSKAEVIQDFRVNSCSGSQWCSRAAQDETPGGSCGSRSIYYPLCHIQVSLFNIGWCFSLKKLFQTATLFFATSPFRNNTPACLLTFSVWPQSNKGS